MKTLFYLDRPGAPVPRWDNVRNVVDESPANVFYDKESRDIKV